MENVPITEFAYIAFDETSKSILAHGQTALAALCMADEAAPDASVYILDAGDLGLTIWSQRMDLVTAAKNLMVKLPHG